MNLFDSLVGMVKDATREVTVQHILLPSQSDARELWTELGASGEVTSESFGKAAAARSTCGSAQKRPDKKMPQLRGMPGELTFRKGQSAWLASSNLMAGRVVPGLAELVPSVEVRSGA